MALSRSHEQLERLPQSSHLSTRVGDLTTTDWHSAIENRADLVVNCVSSGRGDLEHYRKTYIEGMRSISRWAKGGHIQTFIYTGSTGVYGQANGEVVTEEDAGAPGELSERPSILLEAEKLAHRVDAHRRIVLRLAGLYGPGRHHLLDQVFQGIAPFQGSGNAYINLLHRDDAVSALLAVHRAGLPHGTHTFNVSDGHPATRSGIARWLAVRLHRPLPTFDPDQPTPRMKRGLDAGRHRPHRIVSSEAFCTATGWQPDFPDFTAGYTPLIEQLTRQ